MKKNNTIIKHLAMLLFTFTFCSSILGCSTSEVAAPAQSRDVSVNTVDIYGNEYTDDMYMDAKVVMLNYWEPWCGPCVSEMPDIQKLYDTYKDKGFLVLGIYTTFEMDEEAKDFIENNNITYPILKCSSELDKLSQNYVPATYFIDGNGNFFSSEPFAGSRSYNEWEKILTEYLGE